MPPPLRVFVPAGGFFVNFTNVPPLEKLQSFTCSPVMQQFVSIVTMRHCKRCLSTRVICDGGSYVRRDGARVRYCRCRDCGARLVFVEVPPKREG